MGLMDSVFWTTWTLWEMGLAIITVLLLIAFGCLFMFDFFLHNAFAVLFFMFFLFWFAMVGAAVGYWSTAVHTILHCVEEDSTDILFVGSDHYGTRLSSSSSGSPWRVLLTGWCYTTDCKIRSSFPSTMALIRSLTSALHGEFCSLSSATVSHCVLGKTPSIEDC